LYCGCAGELSVGSGDLLFMDRPHKIRSRFKPGRGRGL